MRTVCARLNFAECLMNLFVSFQTADEAEQNFSEDDGWEFVTLADQVTIM